MAVDIDADTLRDKTISVAREFKASWIESGQYLYSIYKDKLYRTWGFMNFESYCAKELHIKQTTAVKLLKSYYFLEDEKPELLDRKRVDEEDPKKLPDYESVNLLRLAKTNNKFTPNDYQELRGAVLHQCKEPKEVRTQIKKILEERDDRDDQQIRQERRNTVIKRMITTLNSSKQELQAQNLLPKYLVEQISELISKLEDQLE